MAEYDYFSRLNKSLEQAVAYKNGDTSRVRVSVRELTIPEYKASDITRLRSALRLSQRGFAFALGVSARTVEAWEAGRNTPCGSSRHLLYLFEQDHTLVNRFISV